MKVGDMVKYRNWADHEIIGIVYQIYEGGHHQRRPGGRDWPALVHMRALDGETYSDPDDCFEVVQSFISNKSLTP